MILLPDVLGASSLTSNLDNSHLPLTVRVVEVSIVNVPATIALSDDAMVVFVDNVNH